MGVLAVRGELQHRARTRTASTMYPWLNLSQFNKSHTDEARLKLTLKATDDLTLRASGMYQRIDQGGPSASKAWMPRLAPTRTPTRRPPHYPDTLYQTGITAEYPGLRGRTSSRRPPISAAPRIRTSRHALSSSTTMRLLSALQLHRQHLQSGDRGAAGLIRACRTVHLGRRILYKRQDVIQNENDYDTTRLQGVHRQHLSEPDVPAGKHCSAGSPCSITSSLSATLGLRWFDGHQTAVTEAGQEFTVDADVGVPKFLLPVSVHQRSDDLFERHRGLPVRRRQSLRRARREPCVQARHNVEL